MLQVISTLTGRNSTPILDRMVLDYISLLNNRVVDTLWIGIQKNISGCSESLKLFYSFSDADRARTLLSPIFYSYLHSAKFNPDEKAFENITKYVLSASERYKGSNCLKGRPASFIGDTIEVDMTSTFALRIDPSSPVFFRAGDDLTKKEHSEIMENLSNAIQEIDNVSITFGRLIRNYTRVIYTRKISGHSTASEQVDSEVGSIRLRNVQCSSYKPYLLEEDLLHESVHNFLATFELLNYPFIIYGGSNNKASARPVSPWSWRPIQALPFLHAAFVYFSLWNFNLLRLEKISEKDDRYAEVVSRLTHCASGFLVPGRLSECIRVLADVDVRVVQAIDWMQDIVREESFCFVSKKSS